MGPPAIARMGTKIVQQGALDGAVMARICLNMIVKHEAHVIRCSLDSLRPIIDTWCISATGSTDGTQDIIREHLQDIRGQLQMPCRPVTSY